MTTKSKLGSRAVLALAMSYVVSAGCDAATTGRTAAAGGAGNAGGSTGVDVSACKACAKQQCPSDDSTCNSTAGCMDYITCTLNCAAGDTQCASDCTASSSSGAIVAAASYVQCATSLCPSQCLPKTNSGSGGAGSQGGAAGTGGAALHSGENVISINNSWADPGMGVNGLLHISGAMYAYGDGCATYTYSTSSNCISGTLCSMDSAGKNWGVGIGFDFNNTGSNGSPPNTKMPWDATAVGAVGFGWHTTNAPGLGFQVWVTNMDSTWGGQCSAADCGINGPPDGTPSPELPDGTIRFSQMVKDNWGGSGTAYTFNPANILAIQFKLSNAALLASKDFEYCIDQLSVILP